MNTCKVLISGQHHGEPAVAIVAIHDRGGDIDPVTGHRRKGFNAEIPMCQACVDMLGGNTRRRDWAQS